VKAPWVDKFYYHDSNTYVIPSKDDGTVVLGGCRHFGSYDERTNDRDTAEILENCVALVPSLAGALRTGYDVWVGLRPYRNAIRVETELADDRTTVVKTIAAPPTTTGRMTFPRVCLCLDRAQLRTRRIRRDVGARNGQARGRPVVVRRPVIAFRRQRRDGPDRPGGATSTGDRLDRVAVPDR